MEYTFPLFICDSEGQIVTFEGDSSSAIIVWCMSIQVGTMFPLQFAYQVGGCIILSTGLVVLTILKNSQWEGWHPIYEMENEKSLKPPIIYYLYIKHIHPHFGWLLVELCTMRMGPPFLDSFRPQLLDSLPRRCETNRMEQHPAGRYFIWIHTLRFTVKLMVYRTHLYTIILVF